MRHCQRPAVVPFFLISQACLKYLQEKFVEPRPENLAAQKAVPINLSLETAAHFFNVSACRTTVLCRQSFENGQDLCNSISFDQGVLFPCAAVAYYRNIITSLIDIINTVIAMHACHASKRRLTADSASYAVRDIASKFAKILDCLNILSRSSPLCSMLAGFKEYSF